MSKAKNSAAEEQRPTRTIADEAALELMKQLITLASGVLALSATFIGELGHQSLYLILILAVAWLLLLTSILFGLQTISTIVKSRLDSDEKWSAGYGKKSAFVSKYSFTFGIGLFALFAFCSVLNPEPKETKLSIPNVKEVTIVSGRADTTRYGIQPEDTSDEKTH